MGEFLLPPFVVQALFALGGVFTLLTAYVFYHFSQAVMQHMHDGVVALFSREGNRKLIRMIEQGHLPSVVTKQFGNEVLAMGEPRRTFRTLLVLSPASGALFLLSAFLATVQSVDGEMVVNVAGLLDLAVNTTLLIGIAFAIWCAVYLARLGRELG